MSVKLENSAVILFDGVCNLCNWSVNFIIDRDPDAYFKFASLQSDYGKTRLAEFQIPMDLESIVLIEGGKVYRSSTAALRISRKLSGLWCVLFAFIILPPFIRNAVYHWVSNNRYRWFGKNEACRVPESGVVDRFL